MGAFSKFVGKIVVGFNMPDKQVATQQFNKIVLEEIASPSNDGLELKLVSDKNSNTFSYSIENNHENNNKKWLVCFPGNNCNTTEQDRVNMYKQMAKETGCNLLVCSHRNAPNSGEEMVQDAIDNIKKLKTKHSDAEINLYGFSVGGSVAVQAAAKLKEEIGFNGKVIADRSFSDLKSWLKHTRKDKVPKILDGLRSFASSVTERIGWKMDTLESANKLDKDQLITVRLDKVYGREQDLVTPTASSLGNSLDSSKHSEILVTSGADFEHNSFITELNPTRGGAVFSTLKTIIKKADLSFPATEHANNPGIGIRNTLQNNRATNLPRPPQKQSKNSSLGMS